MKVLIDMNLAPKWCELLRKNGVEAVHWSTLGGPSAPDPVIMEWARTNGYIVLTHDLDFGTLLAMTAAGGPSVVQIRTQDVLSKAFQDMLLATFRQFEGELKAGALITVDEAKVRARVLPLTR